MLPSTPIMIAKLLSLVRALLRFRSHSCSESVPYESSSTGPRSGMRREDQPFAEAFLFLAERLGLVTPL